MASFLRTRLATIGLTLLGALTLCALPGLGFQGGGGGARPKPGRAINPYSSTPNDTTPYWRRITPAERAISRIPKPRGAGKVLLIDSVVNNTNVTLTSTDVFGDTECSIAVNPFNTNEIVMLGFSGGATAPANAPLWHSLDGGFTWTKQFTIPGPPGRPGIPNDQAPDWGVNTNRAYITFLAGSNIVTGSTSNAASAGAWAWPLDGGGVTQLTNLFAGSLGGADQPWLLVNRDPVAAAQDNIYVAYDDFNFPGGANMRVSVAYGGLPPNVTVDNDSGTAVPLATNPGQRLADDPRTGRMYDIYQQSTDIAPPNLKAVTYLLNRSTDGGATWSLNALPDGLPVVATTSHQAPGAKFGTVNALLGGIDHAAVDPVTGDVYCVVGASVPPAIDALVLFRVTFDAVGTATASFVSAVGSTLGVGVQAALPSIAVASNRNLGVIYTRFEGFSSDGFPIFSERLAISKNQGATWAEQVLVTFLSASTDNGDPRQRVLGDYMQLKSIGRYFYGAFNANGVPFGRPFANHDAIFLKAFAGGPIAEINTTVIDFGTECPGAVGAREVEVFNTGDEDLHVLNVTLLPGSSPNFFLAPTPTVPTTISPDAHVDYTISFLPFGTPGSKLAVFRFTTDDPDNPIRDVVVVGVVGQANIELQGVPIAFGSVNLNVSAEAEKEFQICNTGTCDLSVSGVAFVPATTEFQLVETPPTVLDPLVISHDSCVPFHVRFTPTSCGPKSANLQITSNDPDQPIINISVTAETLCASVGDLDAPLELAFPPTVIQQHGACHSDINPAISNKGAGLMRISSVVITGPDSTEFELLGMPSFPAFLNAGGVFGNGDFLVSFRPTIQSRVLLADLEIEVADPVTGLPLGTVIVPMCGEGVRPGARLLVNKNGAPSPHVRVIRLQRLEREQNPHGVWNNIAEYRDVAPTTVVPGAPCPSFTYHVEVGGVDSIGFPGYLRPADYRFAVTQRVSKKLVTKWINFRIEDCSFYAGLFINFP